MPMKNFFSRCFPILAFLPCMAMGQEPIRIHVEHDTSGLIGDAFSLKLSWTCRHPENVRYPILQDEFAPGLQILPEDSLPKAEYVQGTDSMGDASVTYRFSAYEEGVYTIPSLLFEYAFQDSLLAVRSDTGTIRVFAPVVDTALDIKDIRSLFNVEKKELWNEYYALYGHWAWILLGAAAATAALVILLKRRKSGKPLAPLAGKKTVSPLEKARRALAALKEKQLWQNGLVKAYHTELTDILREYLSEAAGIPAIEMTNEELCRALSESPSLSKEQASELIHVLDTATLVKFAKSQPTAAEHENSFEKIQAFFDRIGQETSQDVPESEPSRPDSGKSSQEKPGNAAESDRKDNDTPDKN